MMSRELLAVLGAATAILLSGCSKGPDAPPVPAATIENLKVAHACAFKRFMWYDSAATVAGQERMGNLAALFLAVSKSESLHAALHERLLSSKGESTDTSKAACLPLGSTRQALRMALSLERTEFESLYPSMITTAKREGWSEAAEQFRLVSSADSGHFALIREAADRSGTVPMRTYRICTTCGFVTVEPDSSCVVCTGNTFETS